jgi:hypothetical protein
MRVYSASTPARGVAPFSCHLPAPGPRRICLLAPHVAASSVPPPAAAAPSHPSPGPWPVWCADAPSATETLQGLVTEYGKLSDEPLPKYATKITETSVMVARSWRLRRFVLELLALRDRAARRGDAAVPTPEVLPTWEQEEVANELYEHEISRVHNVLLNDEATLPSEAAPRARVRAESGSRVDAAPGPGQILGRAGRRVLAALAAAREIVLGPMTTSPRAWSTQTLTKFADTLPHDAALQAQLLRRLNSQGKHLAVMERVQAGRTASSPACEAEYLRAVVESAAYTDFRGAGPVRGPLQHASLPVFLADMLGRLARSSGGEAAAAGGSSPTATAGATTLTATAGSPLHVKITGADGNPLASALRGVVSFLSTVFVVICLWIMGAVAEGSLMANIGATSPSAQAGVGIEKAQGPYAPKEYSKDTMPEASVKTFKDVKGCEEAKEELQVRGAIHQ